MSRHPMMSLLLRGLVAVVVDPAVVAGPTLVVVLVVVVLRLRLVLVVVRVDLVVVWLTSSQRIWDVRYYD